MVRLECVLQAARAAQCGEGVPGAIVAWARLAPHRCVRALPCLRRVGEALGFSC